MRRLLILTAEFTGHGHKSISDALIERLRKYGDIEIKVIDGFDLMNKAPSRDFPARPGSGIIWRACACRSRCRRRWIT